MSIGRNDPCPCGSGKKYKNCCMRKSRQRTSAASMALRDYGQLMDDLLAYCQRPMYGLDIDSAFNLFWNGDYGVETADALESYDLFRFIDWYIFEYPTASARATIISQFIDDPQINISDSRRRMVESWANASLGVWRVKDAVRRRSLLLDNLITEGSLRVQEDDLSQVAAPGDLVVGRPLPVGEGYRLSVAPILLPAKLADGLVDFWQRAWRSHHEMHPRASREVFACRSGYLFNHYLLQQAQLREDAASWPDGYYDVADSFNALEEAKQQEPMDMLGQMLGMMEEYEEDEEQVAPRFKTIADGKLVLPYDPEPPMPDPDEQDRTFADGKLLLP